MKFELEQVANNHLTQFNNIYDFIILVPIAVPIWYAFLKPRFRIFYLYASPFGGFNDICCPRMIAGHWRLEFGSLCLRDHDGLVGLISVVGRTCGRPSP